MRHSNIIILHLNRNWLCKKIGNINCLIHTENMLYLPGLLETSPKASRSPRQINFIVPLFFFWCKDELCMLQIQCEDWWSNVKILLFLYHFGKHECRIIQLYHSFSILHWIFLSWCLPAHEPNNSWPENICKWMHQTEVLTYSYSTHIQV